jgi:hypothetical protein
VITVIAATGGYFLLFVRGAYLDLLSAELGTPALKSALAVLALSGALGGGLAVWRFRPQAYRRSVAAGALACSAAAVAGCLSPSLATAAGIGLALGWLTVTLVAGLRAAIGMQALGRTLGTGIGLAYALGNLAAGLSASPRMQAGWALAFLAVALVASRWLRTGEAEVSGNDDFRPVRLASWIGIFLALAGMDAAACSVIQHTPALQDEVGGGHLRVLLNATVHLAVAVGAGVWMDRKRFGRVVLAGWAALAGACLLLDDRMRPFAGAELLFITGASLYVVALVFYAARGGRPWLVGIVLAISGGVGAAAGIGLAMDFNRVPMPLVVVACAVVTGLLLIRHRGRRLRKPLLL